MSRLGKTSFEPPEPYDGKLSCTVLRGESSRKGADLPDQPPLKRSVSHRTLATKK